MKGIAGNFGKIETTVWYMVVILEWWMYSYLEFSSSCFCVCIYFCTGNVYIFNLRIHIIDEDKNDVRNRHEDMKTRNAFSGALGAPGNARC